MSLYSLHPIELQLIAQFLPVREILSFARRCRFTLAALDSSFAFQCDPLKFETTNFLPGAFSADRRLMRHVQVSLVWSRPASFAGRVGGGWLPSDADALLAIASQPAAGVVALDATQWPVAPTHLSERVLSSPSMSALRDLRLHQELSPACMEIVGGFSQLRVLQLAVNSPDSLVALEHLPRLTDLRLVLRFDAADRLPCLRGFPSLRSLRLDCPRFHGRLWLPFWSAVPGLVSVSLGNWACERDFPTADRPAISTADFAAAFRSLDRMRSFTLDNTLGASRMLSQLHHASALSRVHLIVRCSEYASLNDYNSCAALAVLRALLLAAPLLTVVMTIHTRSGNVIDQQQAEELRAWSDQQRAEFGQRLQIDLTLQD